MTETQFEILMTTLIYNQQVMERLIDQLVAINENLIAIRDK